MWLTPYKNPSVWITPYKNVPCLLPPTARFLFSGPTVGGDITVCMGNTVQKWSIHVASGGSVSTYVGGISYFRVPHFSQYFAGDTVFVMSARPFVRPSTATRWEDSGPAHGGGPLVCRSVCLSFCLSFVSFGLCFPAPFVIYFWFHAHFHLLSFYFLGFDPVLDAAWRGPPEHGSLRLRPPGLVRGFPRLLFVVGVLFCFCGFWWISTFLSQT